MHPRFERYRPLFSAFAAGGFELFLVGGCVRDVVMDNDDAGDVDFATNARPGEIKAVLREAGFKVFAFGERFGTVATIVDGVNAEITTYRVAEQYAAGSRHPDVEFGDDLVADLSRRDLSINAMAMEADGQIVDPFDGRRAIGAGVLEVPGGGYETTISILRDDPLRLLRIARFAARFGYRPTADATAAARETAVELQSISRERWKMEMDKLLVAPDVGDGLAWLTEVGALAVILPETAALGRLDPQRGVCARIAGTPANVGVRWAVLLLSSLFAGHGVDAMGDGVTTADWPPLGARQETATAVAARFRFSRQETAALVALVSLSLDVPSLSRRWTRPELRRWYIAFGDACHQQLRLAAALGDLAPTHVARCDALGAALDDLLATEDPAPRLPHRFGSHLRRRFDLAGEQVGEAIERVRDAILDEELPNGADRGVYLDWLGRHLSDPGAEE